MGKITNDSLIDVNSLIADDQTELVDVSSLLGDVKKKDEPPVGGLEGALNWVANKVSSFQSTLDSGGKKISDWVLGEVKKQTGLTSDLDAIDYLNTRAQMREPIDQYRPTIDALNVKAPEDFFSQSYDTLAKWYFEQRNRLQGESDRISQEARGQSVQKMGPVGERMARFDESAALTPAQKQAMDSKRKQMEDLDQIRDKLIAPKLAFLDNPKAIGFEYMRLFNPGQYEQVMKTLTKISPDLADPNKARAYLGSVADETIFKAFPQAFLHDQEQQGLKVLINSRVNEVTKLADQFHHERLLTSERVHALQEKMAKETDPASKNQLAIAINHEIGKFEDSDLARGYLSNLADLQHHVTDYWNVDTKYPEVYWRNFTKQWVEDKYKDQDVFSRQLMQAPGIPGEPSGAYGFLGRAAKAIAGTGKEAFKALNAGLATIGLKDSDRAYFQNYQIDQDFETYQYTPEQQQLYTTKGYDVPESVKQVAGELGQTPESFSFLGKPQTEFNWGGVAGTMGDITGQVVGQALISRGVGGVFTQAATDIGRGLRLAGAGERTMEFGKYLTRPEFAQDRVGLFASTYAISYGTNYNQAIDAGLPAADAEHYALISSMGSALTEMINPDTKMLRNAQGKITGSISPKRLINILKDESLAPKNRILKFTKEYLKEAGTSVGKETIEEVADQIKQHVLDASYDINTTNMSMAEDAKQTAITTAIGMIPMGLIGAWGLTGGPGGGGKLRTEALYRAGTDPSIIQSYYDRKLLQTTDEGQKQAVQAEYNNAMTVANTMAGIVKSIPQTNSQGRPFTLEEKAKLAELLFQNRKLSTDATNAGDDVVATPIRTQAQAARNQAQDILTGAAPAYIVNGRAYEKEEFQDFLKSPDFLDNKANFELQVYNDDAVKGEAIEATKGLQGNPALADTEKYLKDRQTVLQKQIIDGNATVVELSASAPGSAELAAAENEVHQANEELRTLNARLETVRKEATKKTGEEISPPPASNNMPQPAEGTNIAPGEQTPAENIAPPVENAQQPDLFNAPPAQQAQEPGKIIPQEGDRPVNIRSQGEPVIAEGQLTPEQQAESDKVGDVVKQKFTEAPKVISPHVFDQPLPSGDVMQGRLALVPATAITASHNPFSFGSSAGYPLLENGKNPNDRNYQLSENKGQVVRSSMAYDARAIKDVPTVTPDGVVIDGNQRTMAGQLAAANNTDEAYLKALQQRLPTLGFTQADFDYVAQHGKPRLVFLTNTIPPYNTQTFAAFNQQEKKEKSPMAKAIELGRTVGDDVIARIGNEIEGFETLSEFYADKKATNAVFDILVQNGVLLENELPGYYSKDSRSLTERGKEFLESLMLGKLITEDNLGILNKEGIKNYRQKIVRAIRALTEIEGLGADFSLKDILNRTIRLKDQFEQFKQKTKQPNIPLGQFITQQNMFGEDEIDGEMATMFAYLDGTQTEFKNFVKKYLEQARPAAAGQVGMFDITPASKASILVDLIQKLTNEQRNIVKQAEAIGQQRQQARAAEGNQPSAGDNQPSPENQQQEQEQPPAEGEPPAPAQQEEPVQVGGEPELGINIQSPQNTSENATLRETVQNQEVPPEGGSGEPGGAQASQQEQTGGQEAQPQAEAGNRPQSSGGAAPEVVPTLEGAKQRAIELLDEQARADQLARLNDMMNEQVDNPAPVSPANQESPQVEDLPPTINPSQTSPQALINEAQSLADGVEGFIYQMMLKADPVQALFNISQQLHEPGAAEAMRRTVGDRVADIALLLFPEATLGSTYNPGQRADLSEQAQYAYTNALERELQPLLQDYYKWRRERNKTVDPKLPPALQEIVAAIQAQNRETAAAQAARSRREYQRYKRSFREGLPRRRGANFLVEKFSNAARRGYISQEAADLAIALVQANPELFEDLALSITKRPGSLEGQATTTFDAGTQAYYDSADMLVRIFKEAVDDQGAAHELLHHGERFLPDDIRAQIVKEWRQNIDRSRKQAMSALKKYGDTISAEQKAKISAGLAFLDLAEQNYLLKDHAAKRATNEAMQKLWNQVGEGDLYQYWNPSEWWAVNASRLFEQHYISEYNRAREKPSWLGRAKKFFQSLVKTFKNALGLNKTLAVERGLNKILRGGTTDKPQGMLHQSRYAYSLSPQYLARQKALAISAIENLLPAGVMDIQSVINHFKSQPWGNSLLPFVAEAYRNVRDDASLYIAPGIRNNMSDDATVDKVAASEIGATSAEVAAIGSMYMNRIINKGQTIPDVMEEVNMLPISRDRRTAIMDYINREIEAAVPSAITQAAQKQRTWVQKRYADVAKFGKKQLTVGGLVPKTVRMLKEQEMGLRNEWTVKIKHLQQDFHRAVAKAYPKSALTQDVRESMDAALHGNTTELAKHPQAVQQAIQNFRTFIDSLTEELKKAGVIPAIDVARDELEQARQNNDPPEVIRALEFRYELAKTVEDRLGTYLHRAYEKFRNKDFKEKILADQRKIQAATNYLYNVALINQGKQLTQDEINAVIDAITSAEDPTFLYQANSMNMDLTILKHMKDIPVQIRDLMGEIKDPEWNFVNTTIKMASLLERHKFLNNVFAAGKNTLFTPDDKPDISGGKTHQLKSYFWGPLRNKFTTPEMGEALETWGKNPTDNNPMLNFLRTSTSWAKSAKTSLSWVSEIRNLLGNAVMLFQNGNFTPSEFKKGLLALQDIIGKTRSPQARQFLERMARYNITNQNLPAHEINNVSRELFNIVPDQVDWNPSILKKIGNKLNYFKTKAGEFYGSTDDIFKIITFMNEREKLENAYNKSGVTKTDEELDQEAAYITTHIMPTFYKVPQIVRFASQHVPLFGNFMSYPIELLRTTYNTVQLGMEQMRSTNPEIRKLGAERLAWFMGTQMGTTMLPLLVSFLPAMLGMGGGDGDKRDAIYELMPEYYKNNAANVIENKDGTYSVHLMNSIDGQDWFKQIILAAVRGDGFDKVTGPIGEFMQPFSSENMVIQKMLQWHDNEDQYGNKIYNEEDKSSTKALAFTKHFGDMVEPQTVTDAVKTTSAFMGGDQSKGLLGLLRLGTGQTVIKIDPKKIAAIRLHAFDNRVQEARRIKDPEDRAEQVKSILLEKKQFLEKIRPIL